MNALRCRSKFDRFCRLLQSLYNGMIWFVLVFCFSSNSSKPFFIFCGLCPKVSPYNNYWYLCVYLFDFVYVFYRCCDYNCCWCWCRCHFGYIFLFFFFFNSSLFSRSPSTFPSNKYIFQMHIICHIYLLGPRDSRLIFIFLLLSLIRIFVACQIKCYVSFLHISRTFILLGVAFVRIFFLSFFSVVIYTFLSLFYVTCVYFAFCCLSLLLLWVSG